MALPDLEGWNNTVVLREGAVDSDDAGFPFVAGDEVGHCLFDGGAEIHSSLITNLFRFAVSDTDHISTTKRLDDKIKGVSQHDYARTQSDWNTMPPFLRKE